MKCRKRDVLWLLLLWPLVFSVSNLCSVCAGHQELRLETREHPAAHIQPGDEHESTPDGGVWRGCAVTGGLSRTEEGKTSFGVGKATQFFSFKWDGHYLLEKLRHLAHQTGVALHLTLVPVRQEKVTEQGCVCQRLDDTVHKARVAQVDQTSQAWQRKRKTFERMTRHLTDHCFHVPDIPEAICF